MSISRNHKQVAYGLTNALQSLAPDPIVSSRAPATTDSAQPLTLWLNKLTSSTYICAGTLNGSTTWTGIGAATGTFSSVTINGGSGTVLNVTAGGNTTLGGTLAVSGATTLSAALTVNSGSGAIGIGTDAVAKNITIGNSTGATTISIQGGNAGSGAVNIATAAHNVPTVIGNATTGSTVTINTPTGIPVALTQGASISGVYVLSGAGSPNTSVTAPQGSLYLRTDGSSTSTRAYINTNGTTGWTAITTAA